MPPTCSGRVATDRCRHEPYSSRSCGTMLRLSSSYTKPFGSSTMGEIISQPKTNDDGLLDAVKQCFVRRLTVHIQPDQQGWPFPFLRAALNLQAGWAWAPCRPGCMRPHHHCAPAMPRRLLFKALVSCQRVGQYDRTNQAFSLKLGSSCNCSLGLFFSQTSTRDLFDLCRHSELASGRFIILGPTRPSSALLTFAAPLIHSTPFFAFLFCCCFYLFQSFSSSSVPRSRSAVSLVSFLFCFRTMQRH